MALLFFRLGRRLQREVELDFRKPTADTVGRCTRLVITEGDFGDQLVTGGVGEIVMQVLIAIEVDGWSGDDGPARK